MLPAMLTQSSLSVCKLAYQYLPTSLLLMRYLTSLPLSTASVWLSKSGGESPLTLSTNPCHLATSASRCLMGYWKFSGLRKQQKSYDSTNV